MLSGMSKVTHVNWHGLMKQIIAFARVNVTRLEKWTWLSYHISTSIESFSSPNLVLSLDILSAIDSVPDIELPTIPENNSHCISLT